jgi:NAD/NADP transhydrogenase alpha subunit
MTHDMNLSNICTLIFIRQVFSPAKVVCAGVGVLLSVCILLNKILWAIVTAPSVRQLRMLEQAKIP